MKIINMGRGQGKTKRLIQYSSINNVPIVCWSRQHCKIIKEQAKEMNLIIPEPIVAENQYIQPCGGIRHEKVVIDDLEFVLRILTGSDVDLVTTSCEMEVTRGDNRKGVIL